MGLDMIVRVKRASKAKGTARCVLYGLADAAQLDGLAWPGRRELRQWGGCSEPTLSKALEALEAAGELVVARGRRRPNGRQTSNAYWLPRYADKDAIQQTLKAQDDRTDLLGLFVDAKGDRLNPSLPLQEGEPTKPVFTPPAKPVFTPMLTGSVEREINILSSAAEAAAHSTGQEEGAKAEQVGPDAPTIAEMVEALALAREYPIVNFGRHVRAAKRLLQLGFGLHEVRRTVEYIRREARYLDGQPISMETVSKFVGVACPPQTAPAAPARLPDWVAEGAGR